MTQKDQSAKEQSTAKMYLDAVTHGYTLGDSFISFDLSGEAKAVIRMDKAMMRALGRRLMLLSEENETKELKKLDENTDSLAPFIGMWADLSAEEESVLDEVMRDRNAHMNHPEQPLFEELED